MKSIKDTTFIIIDVETTGLHSTKKETDKDDFVADEVVEIAAGYFKYGEDLKIANSLINPNRQIPSRASAVHHIIDEDVVDSPIYEKYASKLYKRIPEDAILVAHNAPFDQGFLKPAGGIDIVNERDWICSYRLSKLLFEDLDSYANQALRYELKLDVPRNLNAHRASGDIAVSAKLFEREIDAYLELGNEDNIEAFLEFSSRNYIVKELPNGKYRGELIADVAKKDLSYLKWYRDNMDTEEDIIISVKNAIDNVQNSKKAKSPI